MSAAKVAISLPESLLAALDRARRKLGVSRSAAVQQAIASWVAAGDVSDADRRYAAAYLRQPESAGEASAVAAEAVATWEPWE